MPSEWTKAKASGGNDGGDCVWVRWITEADRWTGRMVVKMKMGHQVIVNLHPETAVLIRDEHGNVCQYTATEWKVFIDAAQGGEFNDISGGKDESCAHTPDGGNHPVSASV